MCIQPVIITHLLPTVSEAPIKAPTSPVASDQESLCNNQNKGGYVKMHAALQKGAIFCTFLSGTLGYA